MTHKIMDSGVVRDATPAEAAEIDARAAAAAEELVPEQVAMWQARAILIDAGLLDQVNAVLNAINDPVVRAKALAKFEYSNTVRRDDPLLTTVVPALGKTEAEIDAMFIAASKL
jgi:hypothetical protein